MEQTFVMKQSCRRGINVRHGATMPSWNNRPFIEQSCCNGTNVLMKQSCRRGTNVRHGTETCRRGTDFPSWNNHAAMGQTSVMKKTCHCGTDVMEQSRRHGTIVPSPNNHTPAIIPGRSSCHPENSRESSGVFHVLYSPRRSLPNACNRPGLTERPPEKIARVQWGPRVATEPR